MRQGYEINYLNFTQATTSTTECLANPKINLISSKPTSTGRRKDKKLRRRRRREKIFEISSISPSACRDCQRADKAEIKTTASAQLDNIQERNTEDIKLSRLFGLHGSASFVEDTKFCCLIRPSQIQRINGAYQDPIRVAFNFLLHHSAAIWTLRHNSAKQALNGNAAEE